LQIVRDKGTAEEENATKGRFKSKKIEFSHDFIVFVWDKETLLRSHFCLERMEQS